MDHLLLKAATTVTTEQGTFTAVISTSSVDREGDIVEPQAVVDALHKWVPLGKKLPLTWQHSGAAEDIHGHIDPASAHVDGPNVVVDGWVDQSTTRGKDVWRLIKSGTLGFSYGYLAIQAAPRTGTKGRHITEMDIFEITDTHAPMNGDTRVLAWKSAEERDAVINELQEVKARLDMIEQALEDQKNSTKAEETDKETKSRSVDPLSKRAQQIALEVRSDGLSVQPPIKQAAKETPERVPEHDPDELRRVTRDLMVQVLSGTEVT